MCFDGHRGGVVWGLGMRMRMRRLPLVERRAGGRHRPRESAEDNSFVRMISVAGS